MLQQPQPSRLIIFIVVHYYQKLQENQLDHLIHYTFNWKISARKILILRVSINATFLVIFSHFYLLTLNFHLKCLLSCCLSNSKKPSVDSLEHTLVL